MSSKLHQLVLKLFIQSWRPLAKYAVKAGVVCLQVKLCDPHMSALEVRFSRRGAIQIYVYLYLYWQGLRYRRTATESVCDWLSCVAERLEVRTEKHSSWSAIVADRRLTATDRPQFSDGPHVSWHGPANTYHHQLYAGLPTTIRLRLSRRHVVWPAVCLTTWKHS